MDSLLFFFFPLVVALSLIALTGFLSRRRRAQRLPPGPKPLPVIGNILQLGKKPYETLSSLAKTHGPIMSIHLGSLYTVVVSSPEMAKEFLQRHGQVFSGRTDKQVAQARNQNTLSMGFIPVGKEWRDKRKICAEHVFSEGSLAGDEPLRREMLQQLVDHVRRHRDRGDAVDLRDALFLATINLKLSTLFSIRSPDFDSALAREFTDIVDELGGVIGHPSLADYFPVLKPFDPQGVKRKAELIVGKFFEKFEAFLSERLESRRNNPSAPREKDLLETLVDISQGNSYNFTNQHIISLLFDLLVGGVEANATTVEWVMTELLFHPEKMQKLKEELKRVAGEKEQIEESDIARLPYLQAVVKEILRCHPPGPLLVPRKSEADQEINGYMIPKGTQVLVNVWGMSRDPSIWENPESFEPERFLGKKVDFKGQHFELIPFGAGRRICPGMALATRLLQMMVAVLVHNFEWKLEREKDHEDHKGEELVMALRRTVPLRAIPFKT
nr:cytochrome P450 76AH58 [Salvia officinalis]